MSHRVSIVLIGEGDFSPRDRSRWPECGACSAYSSSVS